MGNPLLLEEDEEYSAIARLIELGRQKSYVTIDDILHFFPEAEQDVEQLEEAFAALLSAGVAFVEDVPTGEPPEDELIAAENPKRRQNRNFLLMITSPILTRTILLGCTLKRSAGFPC